MYPKATLAPVGWNAIPIPSQGSSGTLLLFSNAWGVGWNVPKAPKAPKAVLAPYGWNAPKAPKAYVLPMVVVHSRSIYMNVWAPP